jgi:hypothetical protein
MRCVNITEERITFPMSFTSKSEKNDYGRTCTDLSTHPMHSSYYSYMKHRNRRRNLLSIHMAYNLGYITHNSGVILASSSDIALFI